MLWLCCCASVARLRQVEGKNLAHHLQRSRFAFVPAGDFSSAVTLPFPPSSITHSPQQRKPSLSNSPSLPLLQPSSTHPTLLIYAATIESSSRPFCRIRSLLPTHRISTAGPSFEPSLDPKICLITIISNGQPLGSLRGNSRRRPLDLVC